MSRGGNVSGEMEVTDTEQGKTRYINPEGLMKPRGFSQLIVTSGRNRTISIGGQDAVDENGKTVGVGDLKMQAEKIFDNLEKALQAAGAGLENIVKWNVCLVAGQNPALGFEVFRKRWAGGSIFR
jgi:enamine deaminase RidA (YjgF/YER057c/UK114 family)